VPPAQRVTRRSGAAAPLLESIKARTAGSAVRSVIDQLLAAPAATTTAPTPTLTPPPKNPD
jgi:hypothetical protein